MSEAVYIFEAIRTPRGKGREGGALSELTPLELTRTLFDHLRQQAPALPEAVGDVVMGCVTQVGEQGGNVAKMAVNFAGWPQSLPGLTVNRYCTSALDAMAIAAARVEAGAESLLMAGGVEMMSRVRMLADKPPAFLDPQLATRVGNIPLGIGADLIASLNGIEREMADAYAVRSQLRAAKASEAGYYASLVPVTCADGRRVSQDEAVRSDATIAGLAALEPSFQQMGANGIDAALLKLYPSLKNISHIHHAGNSPAMVDAASMTVLGREAEGIDAGLTPRARIVGYASACGEASLVLTGGIVAAQKLMQRLNLTGSDFDLVEFNEAFAATSLLAQRELGIDDDRYNVNGGAIALGHPMGASGAILVGTALDELERRGQRRALIAISGAVGTGTAMVIERV